MKRFLKWFLVSCLVLALAACGQTTRQASETGSVSNASGTGAASEQRAEGAGKKITIGLAMHNQTADWAVQFKDSFLEEGKKLNAEVVWNDANATAATQVNNIEDLVAQKIDVLVVDPADYSALGQALKDATDAGVKVVDVDSKVVEQDQAYVTAFVTADSYKGGYTLGEYLAENLPKGATIGQLNYPQLSVIADRFDGMQKALADKKRDDIQYVNKDVTDLNAIATYTEDMLMANPEISAIVCLNDNTALSAYATAKQMKHPEIKVYGFDGSPAGKQSISNKEMSGTMVYSPVDLAKTACDTAYAIATKGKFEKETHVDMWLISPENIVERKLDAWE